MLRSPRTPTPTPTPAPQSFNVPNLSRRSSIVSLIPTNFARLSSNAASLDVPPPIKRLSAQLQQDDAFLINCASRRKRGTSHLSATEPNSPSDTHPRNKKSRSLFFDISLERINTASTPAMGDTAMTDPYASGAMAGPSKQPFALRNSVVPSTPSAPPGSAKVRKRPAKLALVPAIPPKRGPDAPASRSVPASPVMGGSADADSVDSIRQGGGAGLLDGREDLRDTLRGNPRRRPSVLFSGRAQKQLPTLSIPPRTSGSTATTHQSQQSQQLQPLQDAPWTSRGPPAVWQDPSEHILSGQGSSLQHARSCYASGPIEVLPGLFLGDEFNARDEKVLAERGITTILNVAKETTLPCQEDDSSRDLGFLHQSLNLSRGLERRLHLYDEAITPTSAQPSGFSSSQGHARSDVARPSPPPTAFFSPMTSIPPILPSEPPSATLLPASLSRPSSIYLRNTSSTPNLNCSFQPQRTSVTLPGAYRSEHESSDEDEDDEYGTGREGARSDATSSFASHVSSTPTEQTAPPSPSPRDEHKLSPESDITATTPSSSTFSRRSPVTANDASTASSSSTGSYTIALPDEAVALSVPPSSTPSGRTWPIRYIKLPWTHDETDLALMSSTGGFVTGCAIIADALGVDVRTGQVSRPTTAASAPMARKQSSGSSGLDMTGASNNAGLASGRGGGGVLVHCQCGVSRSATMVIAFVMQAAAYEYEFEGIGDLTGMHDCYEMVKSLSASISPNISLIYQLVEWERLLSGQAASRHLASQQQHAHVRDVSHEKVASAAPSAHPSGERKWGKEVMGEEDWMRMRAEEERKEREEEERQKERMRSKVAQEHGAYARSAAGMKPTPSLPLLGATSSGLPTGVGARRMKGSPTLTLLSSSKTNADKALGRVVGATDGLPPRDDDDGGLAYDNLASPPATSGHAIHSHAAAAAAAAADASPKPRVVAFPWLQGQAPSSRSSSRPGSGQGAAAFGATGQSAAERRMKHKRTFSAEVPEWSARQSAMTRSRTDSSRLSISVINSADEGPNEQDS